MAQNDRAAPRGNAVFAIAALALLAAAASATAQFKAARQLTSNNVVALAGNGDTLWLATERGFNYRARLDAQNDWLGFGVNDLLYRFWAIGFGGGGAAALINNSKGDSVGFWHFNHGSGLQRQKYLKFSSGVYGSSADPAGGIVYSNGSFWAPFNRGGMVRYDPSDSSVHAIRPGDAGESLPQNLGGMADGDAGARAVLSLDVNPLDNSVITVTTPKALWRYRPADKQWSPIDTNPLFENGRDAFVSFNAAFTVNRKGASTLYSYITVNGNGVIDTVLYGFDNASNKWRAAVGDGKRYSVSPAVNGCVYMLSDNEVGVYADTSAAGGFGGPLSPLTAPAEFRAMLAAAGDDPNPEVNDILFLPKTDSSGTLAVATAAGLYVCESAEPLSNRYGDFKLYRYVRGVGPGEAYALPGVIRGSMDGRYDKCVFVYKLKKAGDVTIRVYDYNMSLVKTVVKGGRRSAGESRSTDPEKDFWDGTNNRGKRVWPGVYYFKITCSAGERLFGKVILAK
jgi:hypothetical protein